MCRTGVTQCHAGAGGVVQTMLYAGLMWYAHARVAEAAVESQDNAADAGRTSRSHIDGDALYGPFDRYRVHLESKAEDADPKRAPTAELESPPRATGLHPHSD